MGENLFNVCTQDEIITLKLFYNDFFFTDIGKYNIILSKKYQNTELHMQCIEYYLCIMYA